MTYTKLLATYVCYEWGGECKLVGNAVELGGESDRGKSGLDSLCTGPQFVSDGLFRSELNSFLKQELSEDGYSGVEVRVTPTRTEIIILATRTQNVLGEKGRRIRELTAVVQKRFNFPEGTVEVHELKPVLRLLYYLCGYVLRTPFFNGLCVCEWWLWFFLLNVL